MDKVRIAVAVFDKNADLYQQKYMDVSMYGESFRVFCGALPENASVLELACGPGNITRFLLDYRPDLKVYATDLAPKMIGLGKKNVPEAEFGILDSRDILKLEKKFDAILCGFCLPYLSKEDAIQLIADAYKVLNDNGILYLSTMEDDYEKSGIVAGSTGDTLFMHYHEAAYLNDALSANGFTTIYQNRLQTQSGDKTIIDLMLIGQK